jgi:hypothetical protein
MSTIEIHDNDALLSAVNRYAGLPKPTPNDCERPVYVTRLRGDYDGGRLWAVTIEGTPVRAALFIEDEAVYIVRPVMRRNPGPLGAIRQRRGGRSARVGAKDVKDARG